MTTTFSQILAGNQISNENATLTYQRIFNPEQTQQRFIDIPPPGTPREGDVSMIYYKDPETGATYWLIEKSSAKIIGKIDKFNDEK